MRIDNKLKPIDWGRKCMYDYIEQERPAYDLTAKVRCYLLYLGYKMELCPVRRFVIYTSPQGKRFYSLRTCLNFELNEAENSTDSGNLNCSGKVVVCSEKRESELLNVEPKYCPEVVGTYVKSSSTELQDEVRGHLSAIGWKFWFKNKKGREEWRYDSPNHKTYYSLKSACRAILQGLEKLSFDGYDEYEYPKAAGKRNQFSIVVHSEQEQEVGKKRKGLSSDYGNVTRSSKRVRQAGAGAGNDLSLAQGPRTVLSWLIDNGAVLGREKVHYYIPGNGYDQPVPVAEGKIDNYGIKCSCCRTVFSLSGFEAHSHAHAIGGRNCHRPAPAANIFFCKDGKSLVQRQLELMHHKIRNNLSSREQQQPPPERSRNRNWNDNVCSVCRYGGELMMCDQCPSSFHAKCLGFQDIPEGDWYCPSCCCGICGESNFDCFADRSILSCYQCERLYHACCIRARDMVKLCVHPTENWFCSKMCEKVHWSLQQLLDKPILVGHDNLTWTLMKPMDYKAAIHDDDCDVVAVAENYSKLNVALQVMHECFEPVKEPQSKRDIVEDVIFCNKSCLKRLNFRGFYTVLLERNDELITVAIIRVYGDKVAEIPLIGTQPKHRRLGMCRIVLQQIEKILVDLGVKKLVLPAAASVLNTWTSAFGFSPVTNCERSEFLSYSLLDFQGTIMCQKTLTRLPLPLPCLSRNISGHGVHQNLDGNSAVSEVSQEDGVEGVDQGTLTNSKEENSNNGDIREHTPIAMVTDSSDGECEPCNYWLDFKEQKIEGDKSDRKINMFYKRNKAPVPQSNGPEVQVSCR